MANEVEQIPVDPWAEAFAAVNRETQEDAQESVPNETGSTDTTTEANNTGTDTVNSVAGEETNVDDQLGGFDLTDGNDVESNVSSNEDDYSVSEEELESYRNTVTEDITNQAINDVARAYINKGARHTNGVLGATIDDKDICKRDEDGVPHFYNPDTGREFTGDNPRRQAQEWCDDYNRNLANAFNKTCQDYSKKLMDEREPQFATLEFVDTFNNLDPVRQIMFDQIIEGHEIYDKDGDLIGYDCDLNLALKKVNNQVRFIQQHYQQAHQNQSQTEQSKPTGPALDMNSSPGGVNSKPKFNSIADAIEYEQNKLLANLRAKDNK